MANDRIEQYLEAILEKLNDGTETGVPVPAWNIEKYLAAIYDKCGGGGSGGLPTPAAADVGKVATVVESISKGTVIAAEQTVTLNGKTSTGIINNVDTSLMTDGAILVVTIDDVEYVVTCVASAPISCGNFTIYINTETTLLIEARGGGTVDVAINLGVASYSWQPAVSGGGVLVVHDEDGTLDKTWQEIHDVSTNSVVILNTMGNICYLTGAYSPLPPMTTAYSVGFFDPSVVETLKYSTESASGYPTASE